MRSFMLLTVILTIISVAEYRQVESIIAVRGNRGALNAGSRWMLLAVWYGVALAQLYLKKWR